MYLETLKTLTDLLNNSENKAQMSLNVLNDLVKVEKALQEEKVVYIIGPKTYRPKKFRLISNISYHIF